MILDPKVSASWSELADFFQRHTDCDLEEVRIENGVVAKWRMAEEVHYFQTDSRGGQSSVPLMDHPSWQTFIHLCSKIKSGTLQYLKVRNGLPASCKERLMKKPRFKILANCHAGGSSGPVQVCLS